LFCRGAGDGFRVVELLQKDGLDALGFEDFGLVFPADENGDGAICYYFLYTGEEVSEA